MIENGAAAPLRHRPSLLLTALGFALLRAPEPVPPVIAQLRRWLDTWKGIGLIAGGMARQGYDLSLTRYDEGGVGIRADAVAGGTAGGVGDAADWTIGQLRVECGPGWTPTQQPAGLSECRQEVTLV